MKKVYITVLLAALSLSLLAFSGCGSKDTSGPEETTLVNADESEDTAANTNSASDSFDEGRADSLGSEDDLDSKASESTSDKKNNASDPSDYADSEITDSGLPDSTPADSNSTDSAPASSGPIISYGPDTGDEDLNAMCDEVLADILTDDMTEREQLKAIYDYVESTIHYVGGSDTSSWRDGAILALSTHKGDCFAFYSSSRALLTRAGFENCMAHMVDNSHYWNMVKTEGNWYHFDTTTGWGTQRFLWTTDELLSYQITTSKGYELYYEWDPTGMPDTP